MKLDTIKAEEFAKNAYHLSILLDTYCEQNQDLIVDKISTILNYIRENTSKLYIMLDKCNSEES